MLSHDEFRQQKGDFEMKKKQNRHSLHLIRQNVPQFILLVIFSVLLGVSVIAVSVLMKMFLDIATNASAMPLTTCLIIAVGGSSKGLGAAGIDADEEKVRVQKIIDKFKDSTTIIVAHIGGEARRGELSDGFINAVLPYAQYILVVKGGDNDGLFTQAAQTNGIPMDVCESISEVGSTLLKAFK